MTAPLVPAKVNLRNFPYMPLDVLRLRDSSLAAVASAEEFRAAVLLWCASWHQQPAASLPQDDVLLAVLAGYGRDVEGWARVKVGALRGFAACADGRLYHPVIAQKAIEAWVSKLRSDRLREDWRKRKERSRGSGHAEVPGDVTRKSRGRHAEVPGYVTRESRPRARVTDTKQRITDTKQRITDTDLSPSIIDKQILNASGSPKSPRAPRRETGSTVTHGTRLLLDELPEQWHTWAETQGKQHITETWLCFHDYWIGVVGQRGRKADWFATWRNWVRKDKQNGKGRGPPAVSSDTETGRWKVDPLTGRKYDSWVGLGR